MDEEMEYAEMLEIPVSTVKVTKKRGRKPKKQTELKEEVISKVNENNAEKLGRVDILMDSMEVYSSRARVSA